MNDKPHRCPHCGSLLDVEGEAATLNIEPSRADARIVRVLICPLCIVDASLLGASVRVNRSFLLSSDGALFDGATGFELDPTEN
jgi:hypothetical protein